MGTVLDPRAIRSRDAILTAARALLLQEGPSAVTHQRVAHQAGVGRATVYRHWPRPGQLLLDVMTGAELPFFDNPTPPVRAWLHGELRTLADQLAMPDVAAVALTLMHGATWDPAIAKERDRFITTISTRLAAALTLAVESGEFQAHPGAAGDEAALIIGPIVYRTALEADSVPDRLLEQLLESVGTWH